MNTSTSHYRVYLLTARRKDNPQWDAQHSTPRIMQLVDESQMDHARTRTMIRHLAAQMDLKPDDNVRLYVSVNRRDPEKIQRALMHHLIDGTVNLHKMHHKLISLAMSKEQAAEKKWLLDVDTQDPALYNAILQQITSHFTEDEHIEITKTPNGYAVCTPHGFDSRELCAQYSDVVEVKKDGLLFVERKSYAEWMR